VLWKDPHLHPRQVVCLACGAMRVVIGPQTGECPCCHYVGWASAEELDTTTSRMIMNGVFARSARKARLTGCGKPKSSPGAVTPAR